jgi:hypothetical protein
MKRSRQAHSKDSPMLSSLKACGNSAIALLFVLSLSNSAFAQNGLDPAAGDFGGFGPPPEEKHSGPGASPWQKPSAQPGPGAMGGMPGAGMGGGGLLQQILKQKMGGGMGGGIPGMGGGMPGMSRGMPGMGGGMSGMGGGMPGMGGGMPGMGGGMPGMGGGMPGMGGGMPGMGGGMSGMGGGMPGMGGGGKAAALLQQLKANGGAGGLMQQLKEMQQAGALSRGPGRGGGGPGLGGMFSKLNHGQGRGAFGSYSGGRAAAPARPMQMNQAPQAAPTFTQQQVPAGDDSLFREWEQKHPAKKVTKKSPGNSK